MMLATSPVLAQGSPSDRVAAQTLFDEAMGLMKEARYPEACPKLQESQRLDPGIGTLFNLSDCYERVGQLASAWAGFREVADLARHEKQKKREDAATARATALWPRLARLTIEVPSEAALPGLEVRRDGVLVGSGQWGTAVPIDPGQHEIVGSAPGRQAWKANVTIEREGATEVVRLPTLASEAAPATPAPPAPPPATTPAPASTGPGPSQGDGEKNAVQLDSSTSQRTWSYVLGGLGIAGLGASAYFALGARSKYDDSVGHCSPADENRCDATGVSLRDDARQAGNIATVAFGLGTAALVGGVVLWTTAPSGKAETPSAQVRAAPVVGRDGAGVVMGGAF